MDLLLIRHGQTIPKSVDGALTSIGELQGQKLGKSLADRSITALMSSPLLRALGTASYIAEALSKRPVEIWPELREGLFVDYQGYTNAQLQQLFPNTTLLFPQGEGHSDYAADTQESMLVRCHIILDRLRERFTDADTVALVTHGGMITYMLQIILQTSPQQMNWFEVKHASLSWIRIFPPERQIGYPPLYPPMQVAVRSINDTAHVKD